MPPCNAPQLWGSGTPSLCGGRSIGLGTRLVTGAIVRSPRSKRTALLTIGQSDHSQGIAPQPDRSSGASCRANILIHSKQVVRIITAFDLRKPAVIASVDSLDAVGLIAGHEVDISRTRSMRSSGGEQLLCPCNA